METVNEICLLCKIRYQLDYNDAHWILGKNAAVRNDVIVATLTPVV